MSSLTEKEQADAPVYFQLADEYRRCGLYLILGYLVIAGTAIGLQQQGIGLGWEQVFGQVVIITLVLIWPLLAFRYLLRVDDRGIWRRRIMRWDLWPWEAFATGQVLEGPYKDSFVFPLKPPWNRNLVLAFLQEDDRKQLASLIRCVWNPPPLPELPAELTIRWGLRSWACLSRDGIQFGKGKPDGGCFFPWTDVRVRITRLEHTRQDFSEAEFNFPEGVRRIRLLVQKGHPGWKGPKSEVIAAFLEDVVPVDCLLLTATTEPPQTVAEADWRLLDVDRMAREPKLVIWITVPFLLMASVMLLYSILGVGQPNPPTWDFARCFGAGVMCFYVAFCAFMIWHIYLKLMKKANVARAELTEWRDSLKTR